MEPTEDISWHIAETPEDQEICFRLRSTGYRRYYRHIPRKRYADELDYEQLPDGSPRSLTILVTERGKPMGTARASLVRSSEYPFLHAAIDELFDVPHELLQELSAPGQGSGLGELSRLTIYPSSPLRDIPPNFRLDRGSRAGRWFALHCPNRL